MQLARLLGVSKTAINSEGRKSAVKLVLALTAAKSQCKENVGEPEGQEPIGAQHHAGAAAVRTPGPDRVLKLERRWVSLIFSGVKTWEIRSKRTHIRGCIGIISPPYPPDNTGETPSDF